jgi:hypothetical protein
MMNLIRSTIEKQTWKNRLCRRCRHKNRLNTSMKSRSRSILRTIRTIFNNMTSILTIIIKFPTTIFYNIPNFLTTITLWKRYISSSTLSSVGHINNLKTSIILSKAKLWGGMLFFMQDKTCGWLVRPARALLNLGWSFIKN